MIKLEHAVLPSPEQIEFAIEGLRNSFNSWFKSDSHWGCLHLGEERDCDPAIVSNQINVHGLHNL